jgi:predicted CxxxxCH...CXXCH cytochrome family protein
MKTTHIMLSWIAVVVVLAWSGCSELKTDLPSPVAPGVRAHEAAWMDTSSAKFHGKVVQAAQGDVQQCLKCHGQNYQGGTSTVSCVACHQSRGATLHGRGWVDPSSPNFHGNAIKGANWDMRPCQTCHGANYDGGKVGVSCRTCHTDTGGPEACATCHGSTNPAPPRDLFGNTTKAARGVGAHQKHVATGTISSVVRCGECHVVPGAIYSAGHIDAGDGAEVVFNNPLTHVVTNQSGTIDYDPSLPLYTPNPSYDRTTLKCSNTYCHGYFKNGNLTFAPVWNDTTTASGMCGTCHGNVNAPADTLGTRYLPKTASQGGTHPEVAGLRIKCNVCHAEVVDANFRIINPSKHINGKLNVLGEERNW